MEHHFKPVERASNDGEAPISTTSVLLGSCGLLTILAFIVAAVLLTQFSGCC